MAEGKCGGFLPWRKTAGETGSAPAATDSVPCVPPIAASELPPDVPAHAASSNGILRSGLGPVVAEGSPRISFATPSKGNREIPSNSSLEPT